MSPNPQETADLVKFTEEILNGKLHFLCSAHEKYFVVVPPLIMQDSWSLRKILTYEIKFLRKPYLKKKYDPMNQMLFQYPLQLKNLRIYLF